jgi:hypothetical protein
MDYFCPDSIILTVKQQSGFLTEARKFLSKVRNECILLYIYIYI